MVLIFSQCIDNNKIPADPRGNMYAGADQCKSCHPAISASYVHTAHQISTRPADKQSIAGSFSKDSNEYYYRPSVKVVMQQRDNSFYQVAYRNDSAIQSQRFDITVGSGRKAQTYLYWSEDKIFQLPVSYFVPLGSWANSPNYPAHQVRFDRNIPIGCFECHGSFIKRTSVEPAGKFLVDHFDRNEIIYGIDCERCHGPAAKHVAFHNDHPDEKSSKFIVSFGSMSRQQKIDQCAVCHSGIKNTKRSLFYFQPSALLSDYVHPDTTSPHLREIDVHGNQSQLLSASACFIKSKTLDCSSCHNTHVTEREDLGIFSKRCMNCHNPKSHNFCSLASQLGNSITKNCIDCHMPAKPSKLITLQSQNLKAPISNMVRTHLIAVYQDESKKIISPAQ